MKQSSKHLEESQTHNEPKTKQPEHHLKKIKLSNDQQSYKPLPQPLMPYNEIFNEFITCADKYNNMFKWNQIQYAMYGLKLIPKALNTAFNKCIVSVAEPVPISKINNRATTYQMSNRLILSPTKTNKINPNVGFV